MSEWAHDGILFHYETFGEGEPFLFLHGLGGSLGQPRDLLSPLAGYRLILPDQRFHGKTRVEGPSKEACHGSPMSFDLLADDMEALVDQLSLKSFLAGGISMGAGVAVNLALRLPGRVKRLALVRNAWADGPMSARIQKWYRALGDFLKAGGQEAFRESPIYREILSEAPDTAATFLRLFGEESSVRYYEKYYEMPSSQPFLSLKELEGLSVPTLILSTRLDPVHDYRCGELYQSRIPGAVSFLLTPKAVSRDKYREELNRRIWEFCAP